MRAFLILTVVHGRLFLREPAAAFFTLVFPGSLLLLFGAIFGAGGVEMLVPGFMGMMIGSIGLMGIPVSLAAMREFKVLRRFRAAIEPRTYMAADVVVNFAMAILGAGVTILVGTVAFGLSFDGGVATFAAGFTLACLAMFALGYLVASIAPGMRSAQTAGQILFFPMLFLSGAVLPVELMPSTVRLIGRFLPLTYVVELLRNLWGGRTGDPVWMAVAVLGTILVTGSFLSVKLFRWE